MIDLDELRKLGKTVLYRASRDLAEGDNMVEYNAAFADFYTAANPATVLALLDVVEAAQALFPRGRTLSDEREIALHDALARLEGNSEPKRRKHV